MADVNKSPEPRTVTVDMIPATVVSIINTHNKDIEIEVPNAPVTPDTEDKLPESKEDASTQPEGNVEEDLKRKSEEMDVTPAEGTEKKLRLDSPMPEETQDERPKETDTTEVTEAANADIPEVASDKLDSKTQEVGADPQKLEVEMDNPKGEAEAAA